MSETDSTHPYVFIIESVELEDEGNGHFEGEVISKILTFSNIEHQYHYIRTATEFRHFISVFQQSNYRYLHIACHGNEEFLAMTLEDIDFKELGLILQPVLDKKRLFISACAATNDKFANEIFGVTECYSLIGPKEKPNMNDSAIFWSSFYHLMFKESEDVMKRDVLKMHLGTLSLLYKIPIKYYTNNGSKQGWRILDVFKQPD